MTAIEAIYRYPVKSLSPEAVTRTTLSAGEGLQLDRAFALAHGSTDFDPAHPQHLSKRKFLNLMQNEKLATLTTRFDEDSRELTIVRDGKQVAKGQVDQPVGRRLIEQFFAAYMADAVRGSPRLVQAPGHSFSDVPIKCLSLINLASVRDLERIAGAAIDPLRFRGNLYVDAGAPWVEFEWCGREIVISGADGPVRLQGLDRIERCAAIDVDPTTGARDLHLPKALQRGYGHVDMGIYAKVVTGGAIAVGDEIEISMK